MKIAWAGLAAIVAGVIGWLVWPSPPGPLVLRPSSSLTVTITRPRLGTTDLAISTAPGAFILVQAGMPLMGFATPEVAATAAGGGRYTVAAVHLMTTGPWELRLKITPPGGVREDVTLPFDVTG